MRRDIWAGLDVGVETIRVCVIDDAGSILHEASCPSDIDSVEREIGWLRRRPLARVGLEASGCVALARRLKSLGYSVDVYETRQLSKFLRLRRNKTDAGDALGIAEAGRLGQSVLSKVHIKSFECQSLQSRLTVRRFLIRQRVAAVNLLCRQLEAYGGRINRSTRSLRFGVLVRDELTKVFGGSRSPLKGQLTRLLRYCEQLIAEQARIDAELRRLAARVNICRRFMDIPGVGPICALSFYATVGDPRRFRRTTDIGSYFGLAPRIHESGLTSRPARISRMGNAAMRTLLIHSAIRFMQLSSSESTLRKWASGVEERSGRGQARVALARKLAVIMTAMWKEGRPYDPAFQPPNLRIAPLA
jgi:transposase